MRDEAAHSEEILSQVAPLPVLSAGLRSRVLTAVVEAQESRRNSRRLVAGSLSVFALLSWISWRNPGAGPARTRVATVATGLDVPVSPLTGGQGNLYRWASQNVEDEVTGVERLLRSRQDLFSRHKPM
ncbi:MAG: hypothetical protein JSS02_29585 [Planctomycetes bacterium]|nr:hypothetical protein [Planctomycetota bacterium]